MYCWYAQEGKSKVILWLIKLINFHNVVTLIIAWTAGKEHTAITYFDWKAVSSLWEEKLPQQHPLWMFHVGNFHYEYFIYRNVKKGAAQSRVAVSWLECCPVLHWIQWWKRHEVDFEFFFLFSSKWRISLCTVQNQKLCPNRVFECANVRMRTRCQSSRWAD